MDDHYEFVGINRQTSKYRIPHAWEEPAFTPADLPDASTIQEEVFHIAEKPDEIEGEVQRAKKAQTYIGLTDVELEVKIPELIRTCLAEMAAIETAARKPVAERLESLRRIAPAVARLVVRSAPGDYYHLKKEDKYKDDPIMQGADRVRGDQAAILAIVLAGIKDNWPDNDLLLFLNQHFLMDDYNDPLQRKRNQAIQAVIRSGIRLVYSGREDEAEAVRRVLGKRNIFIPGESVDVLDSNIIHNTLDQTSQLAEYLRKTMKAGLAFIEPSNVQAVRSMRMEEIQRMIPSGAAAYLYAMPTVGGKRSHEYRKGEIRGTVFYALTGQASFAPAPHEII